MIKLFATDMDGTWLNDHQDYDHELFAKEFKIMSQRDINFVVASGNQFENLLTRFPKSSKEIYFVAENGAVVAQGHQVLHVDAMNEHEFLNCKKIFLNCKKIMKDYGYPGVVEGLASAYILRKAGKNFLQEMHKYYYKIQVVDTFENLDDQILKVNMTLPVEKTIPTIKELQEKFSDLGFVAGSADSIDMQTPGMNKAVGLEYLSQKLGIHANEMIAFGDSGNDVGMLRYVGESYVTAAAMTEAKKAANHIIGSNNDSAVQKQILTLLNQ